MSLRFTNRDSQDNYHSVYPAKLTAHQLLCEQPPSGGSQDMTLWEKYNDPRFADEIEKGLDDGRYFLSQNGLTIKKTNPDVRGLTLDKRHLLVSDDDAMGSTPPSDDERCDQ